MAVKVVPFTPNRQFVADLLTRAKRFHCSINGVYELDVTDTLQRILDERARGRKISLTALLVKATGLLMERHPRLNRLVFRHWFRQVEAEFDHITCTLALKRKDPSGEEILFPLLIRDANRLTLEQIYEQIRYHKTEELGKLPQIAAIERLKRMPWIVLKYFSYKARSDPEFYEKYFGTYGLSSMVTFGWGAVAGSALSNTSCAFLPATIRDQPCAVQGRIEIRKVLTMGVVVDHYVVDGTDVVCAMQDLRRLIETPVLLDSAAVQDHPHAVARP